MPRVAKSVTLARRKQLRELIRQGIYNVRELARRLDVTEATIRNDLKALGEEVWEELRGAGMVRVLEDLLRENNRLIQAAWDGYHTSEQDTARVGYLKVIRDCIDRQVEIFQKLGVIDRAPEVLLLAHAEVEDEELLSVIEGALKEWFDKRLGRADDSA
jgi:DNA-binding transcriptional ArsR family regulator